MSTSININSTQISALLQLYPMAIPGAEENLQPPGAYHLGISESIHSPSTKLFMVIDPVTLFSASFAVGDSVRLWVNSQETSEIKPIYPGEENIRILMSLPWGRLKNGLNTLYYEVTRVSGNKDQSTPILNVLFNNPVSGITVSHPPSIGPGQSATVTLTRSDPRQFDEVELTIGSWSKTIPYVHPANPITYTLTTIDLQQIGDGTRSVSATNEDQLNNFRVSPTSSIVITANQPLIVPKLISVLDATGNDVPEGNTTSSTSLTLHGEASPGRQVEIYDGSGPSAVPKGKVTADPTTGKWVLTITVPSGARRLYAKSLYHPTNTYSNVRNLTVVADVVVAFLNGPYTVAAGGQVKDIQLSLSQAGQPVAGVIEVKLPVGTVYADGTGGARDFPTRQDGTVNVSGVIASDTPGVFSLTASSRGAATNVAFTIKAYGPAGVVPVGAQPLGVTISADGTRLYVAKSSSSSVAVIDTTTSRVIQNIAVPGQKISWDIGVNKEGTRAYACDLDSSSVSTQPLAIIDLERSVVVATLAAVKNTAGVVLSRSGGLAYVSSYHERCVSVVDLQSQLVVKRIPVGVNPWSLAITANQDRLFVCCVDGATGTNKSISIIDTQSLTVTATIPLIGTNVPYGLAVSPDGRYIYCCFWTSTYNGEIRQIDTQTRAVVRTIPVNGTPRDIVLNRAGTLAYCCLAETNKLATIDLLRGTITAYTSIGPGSVSVAISHDDTRAYVASGGGDSVYVISLEAGLQSMSSNVAGVPTDDPQFGGGSVADSPLFR